MPQTLVETMPAVDDAGIEINTGVRGFLWGVDRFIGVRLITTVQI